MRFVSILLEGFKRFPLREGVSFYHEFTHKLTMFTGRNGAGKTSLLNELTPLPSDKNNFCNKKGYKKIVIEKDKNIYTIISDFRGKVSYSFLLNDQELNTANLISAQRELVYKHFGITQVIHDIIVDREHFCTMSLINRKKLFSSITHLNIDSVLEGYNKLKEELKNNQLLLKNTTSSLLIEEQKLLSPEQLESNKETLEITKKHTDELLTLRSDLQRYLSTGTQEEDYQKLQNLSSAVRNTFNKQNVLLTAYPHKDIERYKQRNTELLSANNVHLTTQYTTLEEKYKELAQLETNNHSNRNSLVERKEFLVNSVRRKKDALRFFKDIDSVNSGTYMALYKLEASLPDILNNLQTNIGLEGEKMFTTEKYNQYLEHKQRITIKLQELGAKEIAIKNNLKTIENTEGNIECPKCKHQWPLKDALLSSNHKEHELESILTEQTNARSELRRIEQYIEEITEYFTLYRQYSQLRKETLESMAPLWETVGQKELVFTDPTNVLTYVNLVGLDLSNITEIKNHIEEINHLTKEIESMFVMETTSQEHVLNSIAVIEEITQDLQLEKQHLLNEQYNIKLAEKVYEQFKKLEDTINYYRDNVKAHNLDYLVKNLITIIDDEIRNLRINTITLEKELHHVETVQYGINRYKKEIEDLQENIKVLELAIKELCPKTGLIAKSVSSFLNTIISNINLTVDCIWDYKMNLKEIDVGNDPLNYKFKVAVEDSLEVGDVNDISSGMKEIIDIAFKQVLYRLLGFDGYPFFLDEAGAKLDSQHRSKYFAMLSSFISNSNYGQIFMITHIDTSIATYREVEVVEL